MADATKAWDKAFTHGSKAMQDRLKKVHEKNPAFQSWLRSSGHAAGTSVKQASKEVKPSERVKSLQAKSTQAYGATKGVKVGGEFGSGEMRDTVKPLTRDQWSKVHAAERAAKAAAKKSSEKPVKPAVVKKPLTQDERMAAIRRALTKAKAKDRFDVPTVNPDDVDHDDLMDVHQSLHVRRGYNEETKPDASMAMTDTLKMKMISDKDKRTLGKIADLMTSQKNKDKKNVYVRSLGLKAMRAGKVDPARGHSPTRFGREVLAKEEVEQIDELKLSDVLKATHGKSPEEKEKIIKAMREKERASKPAAPQMPKPVAKNIPMHMRVYPPDMKYHGDSVELEGPVMNEGKMKDIVTDREETARLKAQDVLGGPVKEKPKMPPGKQPAGYRYVRNLARKAMRGGIAAVHKSMEKTMAKEEVEQVVEQDDTMEKKEMAQTQLHFIGYAAKEILEFIDMGGEIEEWYQNKLSKVQSEVESLHSYIEGEKRRTGMVKEEEQIDEKINLVTAKMGDVIKDFQKSDAPQFKGKSQEERRKMALAAKLSAEREAGMREEVEQIDEKLIGNQHKIDADKSGHINARDFKLLRMKDRLKSIAAKKMGK